MEREFTTWKSLKNLLWDTKLKPKEWNYILNKTTDELFRAGKMTNEELGVDITNTTDRRVAAFFRGYMTTCGIMLSVGAAMGGGRKPNMQESDLKKPSKINVWANRYADQLRETALTVHRLNKSYIEKVEASKQPVRSVMEAGAYGTSMMSGAVMGTTLASEMLAHGVAVLTGGRKPHVYSIRPTFSSREEAVSHQEDPEHGYAAFMRRGRMYQRRSTQLRFSPASR